MKRYIINEAVYPQIITRVIDNLLLTHCLQELFKFFRNNDSNSRVDHMDDYEDLERAILMSEIGYYNYNQKLDQYIITIDLSNYHIPQRKVYIFNWGDDPYGNNCFIFTMNEKGTPSCLEFYFNVNKYLPFASTISQDLDSSMIMTMAGFVNILKGPLNVIIVGG